MAEPQPLTSVFGNFVALGLAAGVGSSSPPDSTGAIGPGNYVEMVNSEVAVYSRSSLTSPISTDSLQSFVGASQPPVIDPQVQFDPQANRWFYAAVVGTLQGSADQLAVGFSKSSDPSNLASGWCHYLYASGTNLFDDFAKLGHDNSHVLIGSNVFDTSTTTPTFKTARIWAIPKPANGTITTCPAQSTAQTFGSVATPLATADNHAATTPVPANTVDSSASGFVVAANPASQIMVWHVTSTPTLVSDGDITVSSYSVPAAVPQPGTTRTLESADARLTNAVALADPDVGGKEAVWTQHTVNGPGGRAEVRWYELIPGNCSAGTCGSTALRQAGAISDASNFVFNGAISPAADGTDAVLDYNLGGASLSPQIEAQSRHSATALGTMTGTVTLASSSANDVDFSCDAPGSGGTCRWGDYAGASPDPVNTSIVWGTNQALSAPATSAANWATVNFALSPNDASPPAPLAGPTGQRTAALRKCKKKHSKRARKKCRKKAKLLPV